MVNDFYIGMYEDMYGCLYHWGIDGMRWGVQNGPPYPLDRQTHNKVVKKGHAEKKKKPKGIRGYIKAKKTAKKRKAALEKARKARAAKLAAEKKRKQMEADKERVLKSGTASEVAKYRGQLTNKELQDVWYRLNTEGLISDKASAENVQKDKVDEFFKKMEKYQKYAETGIKTYDTAVDLYNAFADPKVKKKKIRGGGGNKNKE